MGDKLPPVVAEFDGDDEDFQEVADRVEEKVEQIGESDPTVDFLGDDEQFDVIADKVEARVEEDDDLVAEPTFDADDEPFNEKEAAVEEKMALIDALTAEPTIDADEAPLEEKVAGAEEKLIALDADTAEPTIDADEAPLDEKIAEAEGKLAALDGEEITVDTDQAVENVGKIGTEAENVETDGDRMEQSLRLNFRGVATAAEEAGVEFEDIDQLLAKLGVDSEGATVDAEKFLGALADAASAVEEDVGGAVQDVESGTNDVEKSLSGASGGINTFGKLAGSALKGVGEGFDVVSGTVGKIVFLLPALIDLGVAGIGELGAIAAIGFTAFSGFGAAIIGLIPDLGQLEGPIKTLYHLYTTILAPFSAPVIKAVIVPLQEAFEAMVPVAEAADGALTEIFTTLGQQMDTPAYQKFVTWVAENTGPALETISNFITDVTSMLGEMGENGQPFINMIESGINKFGQDLKNFGSSNTFKDFVTWLTNNGPMIGGDLEKIAKDVGKIATEFSGFGLKVLNATTDIVNDITPVLNAIGSWMSKNDTLQSSWDHVWKDIKDDFDNGTNYINTHLTSWGDDLYQWIVVDGINRVERAWDVAWGDVKKTFSTTWGDIAGTASQIATDLKNWIMDPINDAKKIWDDAWGDMKSAASTVWSAVSGTLSGAAKDIKNGISDAIQTADWIWHTAWSTFGSAVSDVWTVIKPVFDVIKRGLDDIAQKAHDIVGPLQSLLNLAGKVGGALSGTISLPTPAAHAAGGLIDGPEIGLLGEGGQREFVIPESDFPGGFGNAKTPKELFSGGSSSIALPTMSTVHELPGGSGGGGAGHTSTFGDFNFHGITDIEELAEAAASHVRDRLLEKGRSFGVGGIYGRNAGTR